MSLTIFYTKIFLEHRRVPLRSFSVLRDNKVSIENRDMPIFIHKLFSIPENFQKTERFLYKAFRFGPVRQKISTKPRCFASYAWNFSIKEFFSKTKVFSNEKVRYSETKTSTEIAILPPPSCPKFFDSQNE